MKGKVYTTNNQSLMEYIVDINNILMFSINSKDEVFRKGKGSKYKSKIENVINFNIIPKYSIVNNTIKNKVFLYVDIPQCNFYIKLRYVEKHSGTCSFEYSMPQTRIIKEIELSKLIDDFEKAEDFVEQISINYVKDYIKELFKGKQLDVEKEWTLYGKSIDILVKKEVNL